MTEESINLEEKVSVKNLCGWDVYFSRINSLGDVKVASKGIVRLSREEIQSQIYNGNKLFTGKDGNGSHARLYVDDKVTRVLIGFDDDSNVQKVLDKPALMDIFKIKGKKEFETTIQSSVDTQAEKFAAMEYAKEINFNDLAKVKFLEEYTGYRFEDTK
ncbi:hypothetical protein [Paenibacillus sp. FSL H3-0333]|uniref:hypothetical protein n=1 Tax=Paenibacillus sp. FSL H3-0333 TaxID=2921373 RepID=UPI0030F61CEF